MRLDGVSPDGDHDQMGTYARVLLFVGVAAGVFAGCSGAETALISDADGDGANVAGGRTSDSGNRVGPDAAPVRDASALDGAPFTDAVDTPDALPTLDSGEDGEADADHGDSGSDATADAGIDASSCTAASCVEDAKDCSTTCEVNRETCVNECSPLFPEPCRTNCRNDGKTCKQRCVSACTACLANSECAEQACEDAVSQP